LLFLRLFWRGEIDLPLSFWAVFVFTDLILIDKLGVTTVGLTDSQFLLRFYTALVVLFNGFVLPAVWRSAGFWARSPFFSRLARAIVVLAAIRVVSTFVALMSER